MEERSGITYGTHACESGSWTLPDTTRQRPRESRRASSPSKQARELAPLVSRARLLLALALALGAFTLVFVAHLSTRATSNCTRGSTYQREQQLLRQLTEECAKKQDTVIYVDKQTQSMVVEQVLSLENCPLIDIALRGPVSAPSRHRGCMHAHGLTFNCCTP